MEYRFLGSSGLKVSALSYGAWVTFGDQIDEDIASDCMRTAYDAGVNFFDNAEVYAGGRAETMMGSIIKKIGWKRSDLILSTKIYWGGSGPNDKGLSRKHIIEGTDASLKRLQVDYVDLLFCHRPDLDTPIDETVRAMSHVVDQGRAFYWGTSEWSSEQIRAAHDIARHERLVPPTMEQPQYNMFHRERVEKEYASLYAGIGLGTTIWSPLASGLLTGKYNAGIPPETRAALPAYHWIRRRFESTEGQLQIEKVKKLGALASELGLSLPRLAIAWCLKNPNVSTVITGASKPEQVTENMRAQEALPLLTPEVIEKIEEILDNAPVVEQNFR
jgi:voltage-dependent potassium channel beta subunit